MKNCGERLKIKGALLNCILFIRGDKQKFMRIWLKGKTRLAVHILKVKNRKASNVCGSWFRTGTASPAISGTAAPKSLPVSGIRFLLR